MNQIRQYPTLSMEKEGETLFLSMKGDWIMTEVQPDLGKILEEVKPLAGKSKNLCVCGKGIGEWDTSILPYLQALDKLAGEKRRDLDLGRMPEGVRELFDLARAVPERADSQRHEKQRNPFYSIGQSVLAVRDDMDSWLSLIGEIVLSFPRLLSGRARFRARDFFLILEEVGARAFPIVTLISFLVGLIISFLGIVVLTRFNAEYYVSYLVGYGMLREMGALMTGIILSGRTGAAFAAHIGSMKVNEEIDALRAVGVNPVEFLAVPRVIALVCMMPLLTIYADVIGVVSGALVAAEMTDMAIPIFTRGLMEAVTFVDFFLGLIKSVVFGFIIALAGCLRGFQCGSDSGAVGQAATSAVVTSITLIVTFNALIDWIAALYGI